MMIMFLLKMRKKGAEETSLERIQGMDLDSWVWLMSVLFCDTHEGLLILDDSCNRSRNFLHLVRRNMPDFVDKSLRINTSQLQSIH